MWSMIHRERCKPCGFRLVRCLVLSMLVSSRCRLFLCLFAFFSLFSFHLSFSRGGLTGEAHQSSSSASKKCRKHVKTSQLDAFSCFVYNWNLMKIYGCLGVRCRPAKSMQKAACASLRCYEKSGWLIRIPVCCLRSCAIKSRSRKRVEKN